MGVINATAAAALPGRTNSAGGLGDLTSDEFLEIVLAELANQDPLEPNDTSALLDQLSSIRDIEANIDLTENLTSLVDQNEFSSAASLIGLVVSGLSESNERIVDFVSSVRQTEDGAVLITRQGYSVPFSQVDEVITEEELGIGDDDGNSGDGGSDPTDGDDDGGGEQPAVQAGGTAGQSGERTPDSVDPRADQNLLGVFG